MRQPSYLRHKARNLARVVIDGKTHYLGAYGSPESLAEYNRLIAEWKASRLESPAPPPAGAPRLVGDLVAHFWAYAEAHHRNPDGSEKSELDCLRYALRPLDVLYGHTPVKDFGPLALKAYRLALVQGWDDPKRGPQGGRARKYVNRCVVRVRTVFRWAESEELIAGGTWNRLRSVRALSPGEAGARETADVVAAPEESIAGALAKLNPVVRAAVETQLLTAARPGEVLGLRVGDVQRVEWVRIDGVTVDTAGLWVAVLPRHKTAHLGRPRVLLFGPKCQKVLAPLLDGRDPGEYVFRPVDAVADLRRRRRAARKSKVQPSQADRSKAAPARRPGERYTDSAYWHAVAKACLLAGVPHFHPHQLRHAACSRIAAEFGPETARVVLGHAGLSATQIYLHQDLTRAAEAARRTG